MIKSLFNRKPAAVGKEPTSGQQAELFSARYLKGQGLKIIDNNYSCRSGEIDIIALHQDTMVFVEVRLRNHGAYATGAESVDYFKQKKIITSASYYLQQQFGNNPPPCRFDVVSLAVKPDNGADFEVEWIQDAFRADF